jgi:hypothetical protein
MDDQELFDLVAEEVKTIHLGPAAIHDLCEEHGNRPVYNALISLKKQVEAQFAERKADWAEFKSVWREESDYRPRYKEYQRWRASANRYKTSIETAVSIVKKLIFNGREQQERRPPPPGWESGSLVSFRDVKGEVVANHHGLVLILWDIAPLPFQYIKPWKFDGFTTRE